jgi:hypothetical protein
MLFHVIISLIVVAKGLLEAVFTILYIRVTAGFVMPKADDFQLENFPGQCCHGRSLAEENTNEDEAPRKAILDQNLTPE